MAAETGSSTSEAGSGMTCRGEGGRDDILDVSKASERVID